MLELDANAPAIVVRGAETHNLQSVDCRIPHGRLTVVTGPSGAGKSSLAFDTVFAEGQRRFVESMSTYAQQFIQQIDRPPVEAIDNVLPAVALETKTTIRNARSTVGTLTETHDLLRLVFANLGIIACPSGHGPMRRWSAAEAADELVTGVIGDALTVAARAQRPAQGADDALRELVRLGYFRVVRDGEIVRLGADDLWPEDEPSRAFVVGRFQADEAQTSRIAEAIESGYRFGDEAVEVTGPNGRRYFSPRLSCAVCGVVGRRPEAALFSFNSPLGACETCSGFGRVIGIDRGLVVPDPSLSVTERPIAPWNSPSYEDHYPHLEAAFREQGYPLDVPWSELPGRLRQLAWRGGKGWRGIDKFFAWLERRTYRVHVRVLLARYRAYFRCQSCGGARLKPEALAVHVAGKTLPDVLAMSVERLRGWLAEQAWTDRELEVGGHLLEVLGERLRVLDRVGLSYLTLARTARTLSGGETQRIHLAAALSSGLTGTLYVLDEPTVGLHPRDGRQLLALLRDLARRGNTVLVVEHEPTLIEGADWVVELGPGAGRHGGRVVFEGTPEQLLKEDDSLTATFLRRRQNPMARRHVDRRRQERGEGPWHERLDHRSRVSIRGARENNLGGFDVDLPLGALVAVTGVSGSGKSTLVEDVLYEGYRAAAGEANASPGACSEIEGLSRIEEVVMVDQRSVGRSARSMPVTYVGAYDELRKIFAATEAAQRLGLAPGAFSFNVDGGRCPECKGTGEQEIDLQFMGSVRVVCDRCQGRRFKAETLSVRWRGGSIHETLELTVAEAVDRFADQTRFVKRLQPLLDVGLGYLHLGQPTSTLSTGEAQRLKLAEFVKPRKKGLRPRLFLFDEPTTGLHLSDVAVLYTALRRLVERGDGVVVVEHQLDLIARADWVVELGPGGGEHGGNLLFSGPMGEFLDRIESPTADELRGYLGWPRRRRVGASLAVSR